MAEIVDLTALGLDLNTLIRAANNAKAIPGGVTGFKMTTAQIELMPLLIQSIRGEKVFRKKFMGIPIVEAE